VINSVVDKNVLLASTFEINSCKLDGRNCTCWMFKHSKV